MRVPTATELWAVARGPVERLAEHLDAVAGSDDTELIGLAERLLDAVDGSHWPALDSSIRRCGYFQPGERTVFLGRVHRGELGRIGLILAACNPDGHVREAAVERLATLRPSPIMALRAADWVPQVRTRARFICERWLTHSPAASFAVLAPAALAVRDRREGELLATVLESLLRSGPSEVLAAGLTSLDRRTRRLAYTAGVAGGRLALEQLLHAALTDDDLPIRIACAATAMRSGDPDVPRRLLRARTSGIRADAVQVLGGAGDVALAWDALLDRSPVVRATAVVALRRAGHSPEDRYRQLVTADPPHPVVLAGLGETGGAPDIPVLREWLGHPSPRGRAEAVRALRRLGDTPVDLLLPLLRDPAAVVTRQVVASLRDQAHRVDEAQLRELLDQAEPAHVRMAAFRLLHDRDTWTRLAIDLTLYDDADPTLRGRARVDLGNWWARDAATTYSMPGPAQAGELTRLLAQNAETLGPHMVRSLRFHMGLGR